MDDFAVNQKMLARTLDKEGHTYEVVATGKEAIERGSSLEFDVILLDITLPDIDGYEVTKAILGEKVAENRAKGSVKRDEGKSESFKKGGGNTSRASSSSSTSSTSSAYAAIRPPSALPCIVAVTGHSRDIRPKCRAMGMIDVVVKPFKRADIRSALKRCRW